MSDGQWDVTARLRSKVVMVVGATSGIGRAVSLRVAAEGFTARI
jgi:NAD(P)-dependent dehydrogenase (short-subunit alcohol dehydrogenase family)